MIEKRLISYKTSIFFYKARGIAVKIRITHTETHTETQNDNILTRNKSMIIYSSKSFRMGNNRE